MLRSQLHPLPLPGPWAAGYSLAPHRLAGAEPGSGECLMAGGARSAIGELLYRSKHLGDREACRPLAEIAAEFVRERGLQIEVVVPVPPSIAREFQPLPDIAARLATTLGVEYDGTSLRKAKETPQMKSVGDLSARAAALEDAFRVEGDALRGRAVLLLDDLYRSGASMHGAARALSAEGGAGSITALALARFAG